MNNSQKIIVEDIREAEFLLPAFDKNNIALVFAVSDEFVPYLAVALQSMKDNFIENNNYDIIILEKNVLELSKDRLMASLDFAADKNISCRFINVKKYVKGIHFHIPNQALSEETYYSLLVPWVLHNYDKALVLDSDIILKTDIAELYNIDLEGNYLAAVREILFHGFLNNPAVNVDDNVSEYTINTLKVLNQYDYFNAGILLFDLDKFRKNFVLSQLLEEINQTAFKIVEQDLLNKICYGKVKLLDYSWNFMACISDETTLNLNFVSAKERALYDFAANNPYIFHYITSKKPWLYPELKYSEEWWGIARKTLFYELLLARLSEFRTHLYAINMKLISDPNSSFLRKLADKLLPCGSLRRRFVKFLIPHSSLRWRFLKQVYYLFNPKRRPSK